MSPAKVFCAFCFVLAIPEFAFAQFFPPQTVRDVGLRKIEKAIQCEVGNFAQYLKGQRLSPPRLKAQYVVTEKTTSTRGFGIDLNLFVLHIGDTARFDLVGDDVFTFDPIHIHTDNRKACSKREDSLVLLKLRDCLRRAAEVYDHVGAKCGAQINVKTDLSGGVKVPIYYVTFGPSAAWGSEYSRGIQVIAPPPAGR